MQAKSSTRAVNLLFLIVLCLQASNLLFMWMPQYVRMILNEVLFIFLPAYLYLRLSRQPVAQRIRWRWPGWKVAGLALLIGLGLYPLSAASSGLFISLLGYTNFAAPADAIPTTLLMAVLAVIAYAVMAPLCEEFLFRGVIQPVYEQRGPRWAVFFVGFLFIAFHLSLLQGLSIIPLALALGRVNYRTRSLPASILTHFSANALAALVITQGIFKTGIQTWIVSLAAILGGLLVAAAALLALLWLTRRPAEAPLSTASAPLAKSGWLAQSWPLLAAALLYFGMIGAEFYYSRPQPVTSQPLQVGSTPWQSPQIWAYEIRNVADAVVGDGKCTLTPRGVEVEVICTSKVGMYEVKQANSTFSSSGGEREDRLTWKAADGQLSSGSSIMSLQDGSYGSEITWSVEAEAISVHMTVKNAQASPASAPVSDTAVGIDRTLPVLPDNSWPWPIAGITLEPGAGGRVLRFNPYTWRNATQDSGPVAENRLVTIAGPEQVTTPAGQFSAWKVMLGSDQAVWYDTGSDRTPVKFNNGIETWYLKE